MREVGQNGVITRCFSWICGKRRYDWKVSNQALRGVWLVGSTSAVMLALAMSLVACSANKPAAGDNGSANPSAASATGCDPANPSEGCACANVGEGAACGVQHQATAQDVVCSLGHTQCLPSGKWDACASERLVTRALSGLRFQALGDAGPCADPCTPDCTTTVDTPSGIVAPTGLSTDAGLTIVPSTPPPNTCTGLTISPSVAPATDITVTSTSALTTNYFTSALVPLGCNPTAPSPLWYTDTFDVAQMDSVVPGKLTVLVPIAGPVVVGASLGAFTSTVNARVIVAVQELGLANPPPVGATFAQFPAELPADSVDTKLEILYPYSGTVLPLGLAAPLVQWRNSAQPATGGTVVTLRYPATGAAIFEVSQLVSEGMTAPVPLRAAQPRYPVPQPLWFAFEQTIQRNRGTLGDTGRISVRRRVGTTTYKAKSVDVKIASGQLKGLVYYQSYGTALVNNFSGAMQTTGGAFPSGNFGAATLVIPPGGTAPTVAAGFNGSGGCYVCHSASADGATLITAKDSYVPYRYTFPGTPPNGGTPYASANTLIFAGINPTSTRIMSSAGGHAGDSTSRLFDIGGTLVSGHNIPTALKAGYPAFATDNSKVTFNFRGGSASPLSGLSGDGKSVAVMNFDGNKTFSNFRVLTTPTAPSVWPNFLPAGQDGLVYQIETRTSPNGGYSFTRHDCECSTYSGATGELWWVTTGATPVAARLNQLNGYNSAGTAGTLPVDPPNGHAGFGGTVGPAGAAFYEQNYNYEPTVLPQTIGGYSWVIFTSRRAYGNVATINPYASDPRFDNISIDPTPKKLWVAAISNSPTAGTDPSFPAFYLPGQELIAGNSKAAFSLEACHPAIVSPAAPAPANLCDSNLDCCGGGSTAACVLDPPPLLSPPQKHCVTTVVGACRAVGQSCLQTSNCCNAVSGGVCAAGVCTDPPPYFEEKTYSRDYASACAPGYVVRWGLFDWQSKTPSDSKVAFSAQQSPDGTTWSPTTPLLFGTAQGADVLGATWGTTGTKVSAALGFPNGTSSQTKLRITMKFIPSTDRSKAPTLIDWRQSIECVAAE